MGMGPSIATIKAKDEVSGVGSTPSGSLFSSALLSVKVNGDGKSNVRPSCLPIVLLTVAQTLNQPKSAPLDQIPSKPSQTEGDGSRRESHQRPHLQEFTCGFGAAVVDVFITYPLNKLMFRQQLHGILLRTAIKQIRHEGVAMLYRGLLPPLIHKTTCRSIMFGMYDEFQRTAKCSQYLQGEYAFLCKSGAAFMAGSVEALLCPLERVQTLLQSQSYHHHFKNTWHAFTELRPYGLREYYRGLSAILMRNGPSNVVFFGLRHPIRDLWPSQLSGVVSDFCTGALLGATISTIFFPTNVVKARMQSVLGGEFKSPLATFTVIMRERNWQVKEIYRGVQLNFTRSLITWGVINAAYELLEKLLFGK